MFKFSICCFHLGGLSKVGGLRSAVLIKQDIQCYDNSFLVMTVMMMMMFRYAITTIAVCSTILFIIKRMLLVLHLQRPLRSAYNMI